MTDDQAPGIGAASSGQQTGGLPIPEELRRKYPELLDLLEHSESMNDEERQYWIDILPVMTPTQVTQLKDILENEKMQLAAIDAKYAKEIENIGQRQSVEHVSEERHQRLEHLQSQEKADRSTEEQNVEKLLQDLE